MCSRSVLVRYCPTLPTLGKRPLSTHQNVFEFPLNLKTQIEAQFFTPLFQHVRLLDQLAVAESHHVRAVFRS